MYISMDRLRVVWEETESQTERDEREYVWEFDTLLEGGVFGQRKKKKYSAAMLNHFQQQKKREFFLI
jgi:hypothetical protein